MCRRKWVGRPGWSQPTGVGKLLTMHLSQRINLTLGFVMVRLNRLLTLLV